MLSLKGPDSRTPRNGEWPKRLQTLASRVAYLLLFQSIVLLLFQNDTGLKMDLLMQIGALTCFALFSRDASGTYLNAPLVFAASLFIWHSVFLVGHYFELAPIFAFDGGAFYIGFEYVYKATALVGMSLAFTIIGMMWGYKKPQIGFGTDRLNAARTRAGYSSLGSPSKRVALYLLAGMVSILVFFFLREGRSVLGGQYMDLYSNAPNSLAALMFFRSELLWVFVITFLIACYKDAPRVRNLLAIFVVAICVFLAMMGTRTGPFVCLTTLLLSWDCFVRRVRLRWIAAFVLLLSAASFVIASGRGTGLGVHVFQFEDTGKENLELLALFWEQGRSITVVLRTMDLSQQTGLMYGRTFADSIVSVVPLPVLKLTGYRFVETLAERVVDISPDIPLNEGAGSSLVAEFYYNFGMLGSLGFLIIGWFISRAYFRYALSGDLFTGIKVMTAVSMYTVMMRNETGSSWRLLIYAFIVVAILRHKKEQSIKSGQITRHKNAFRNPSAQTSLG